jgi:sodium-dependent dicarboxylate transporter 2/3/5
VFLLVIIAAVNFLTEITSNVATASMLLPILAAVAFAMDVHPFGLMVGATFAASCAFMLPVATPPNAVVFGSGYLTIPAMIKAGFWMNLLSIVLVVLLILFLLPYVWQLELSQFPASLK